MAPKILVIDDDENTLWLVSTLLQHNDFEVIKTTSATEGLELEREQKPDLVLLDVMMPDMDGWEVCRRLRETSPVPIIFITAKSAVKDVVKGLEIGGDDYVVKPFDNHELLARIRTQLRRGTNERGADELNFADGNLRINFLTREVTVYGKQVELTPNEVTLLSVLAPNAVPVLTRTELITQTWGPQSAESNQTLKLPLPSLPNTIYPYPTTP